MGCDGKRADFSRDLTQGRTTWRGGKTKPPNRPGQRQMQLRAEGQHERRPKKPSQRGWKPEFSGHFSTLISNLEDIRNYQVGLKGP